MTTINILALECAIISSTGLVESLDRIAVNAGGEEERKIRDIRKKFLTIRSELYTLIDEAKDTK